MDGRVLVDGRGGLRGGGKAGRALRRNETKGAAQTDPVWESHREQKRGNGRWKARNVQASARGQAEEVRSQAGDAGAGGRQGIGTWDYEGGGEGRGANEATGGETDERNGGCGGRRARHAPPRSDLCDRRRLHSPLELVELEHLLLKVEAAVLEHPPARCGESGHKTLFPRRDGYSRLPTPSPDPLPTKLGWPVPCCAVCIPGAPAPCRGPTSPWHYTISKQKPNSTNWKKNRLAETHIVFPSQGPRDSEGQERAGSGGGEASWAHAGHPGEAADLVTFS